MDSSMRVESVDLDQLLLQIDPAALQTNPNLQETLEWMVNEPSGLPPLYEEISSPHSPNGVLDAMGAAPSAWPLPAAFASDDGSAGHIQEDSPTTTAAAGPPRADPKGRAAAAAAAARTEQQKERVRAKNRRAQVRFRRPTRHAPRAAALLPSLAPTAFSAIIRRRRPRTCCAACRSATARRRRPSGLARSRRWTPWPPTSTGCVWRTAGWRRPTR